MPTKKTKKPETEIVNFDPKEITALQPQAKHAVTYATSLEVTSDKDYTAALEEGKKIKNYLNVVIARKEIITKPMYASYKSIVSLFKTLEDPANDALSMIRSKMTAFHNEKLQKEEAERAKIAAKVESGYIKPETAMKKSEEVEVTEKTSKTETATATMRTVMKWRVSDKSKIPLQFMEPNMTAIKASFRAGTPVEGVEQYEEQELAIS